MPITQEELVQEVGTVELYDGRLSVQHRLNEDATPSENGAIMDMMTPGNGSVGMRALCRVMARKLVSWDLLEADGGEPVEISEQNLYENVKSTLLLNIFERIEEIKNLEGAKGPSSNGSKATPTPLGGRGTSKR